ncbi:hypothetical protein BLNAU_5213 [Blattamonas nauphoetae]|uniref:Uncharacterized protein n=1 Tax=Blattamonas nauphoetae TaxID=2049346 RepID=A0ABQ9Y7R9_9EUKA|nr:hypothetical protein BLNAU_5213 [Blattamonas nauphoetae]
MECSDTGIIDSPPSSERYDSSGDDDPDRSSSSLCHDTTLDEASLPQFSPIAGGIGGSLTRRSTPPLLSDGDPAHSPLGLNTPQAPLLFFNSPSQKREECSPVRTPPSFPSTSPPSTDSSKKSTQSMTVATDLHAHFAKLPRPSLVPPSIIDYESQNGLLPTPAHKLDLTAPLRLLSSNSIDRGPIPPPAMSPHPSPPPQPKSLVRPLPKPRKPPHRSKANNKSSHQPSTLVKVILEHPNLPSPLPPNPKAVVPPKPKAVVPPKPKIHAFRTFVPQSQRQNSSEQATVIPEHPNSPFPSPPKKKPKGPPLPKVYVFRTFVPQNQRQNQSTGLFTIIQDDSAKPLAFGKAESLRHPPPSPKVKPQPQPLQAASGPPTRYAGKRLMIYAYPSIVSQPRFHNVDQSLVDALRRLNEGTYDPHDIFLYEPLSFLKTEVQEFLLRKNLNLLEHYIPYLYPEVHQVWFIGTVMHIIDRQHRVTWIKHRKFPDNVFLDMSTLTPIEEFNLRPKTLVIFAIRVNRHPTSYFEAKQAFVYEGKIQDISIRLI